MSPAVPGNKPTSKGKLAQLTPRPAEGLDSCTMGLAYVIGDDSHTGEALRRHRGEHRLRGTGQCARLAKLVPSAVETIDTAAEMSHRFAEWLASVLLFPAEDVQSMSVYTCVPGDVRMGKALDRALSKIKGDKPRSPAVLRAQLRRIAEAEHAAGGEAATFYVLAAADTYEVATDFPTGAGVDNEYDWMGVVTFKMLLSPVGSLSVYADLPHTTPAGSRAAHRTPRRSAR